MTGKQALPTAEQEYPPEESFLARWSRRKREAASAPAVPAEKDSAGQAPAVILPATIQTDTHADEQAASELSAELQRAAQRKLFHLPQFNVCDGLDDYAGNYTAFTPLGAIVTHEMRRLWDREKQPARPPDTPEPKQNAADAEQATAAQGLTDKDTG